MYKPNIFGQLNQTKSFSDQIKPKQIIFIKKFILKKEEILNKSIIKLLKYLRYMFKISNNYKN
jgi:hypothetical protein